MWRDSFVSKLVKEWNRSVGEHFQISSRDVQWNLQNQNLLYYQLEEIAGVPALTATAAPAGIQLGVSPEIYWISLWGTVPPAQANQLLLDVQSNAKLLGKKRISFGADEFHFVPGVPLEQPMLEPLLSAMEKNGYEGRHVFDHVGSLNSTQVLNYIGEATDLSNEKNFSCKAAVSTEECDLVENFLLREFPDRWLREFRFWLSSRNESSRRSAVDWLYLTDQANKILGFARIGYGSRANSETQVPGNLRLAQVGYPKTEATSLGPIGSGKDTRGMGVGKCLLGAGLSHLIAAGGKSLCIDWTEDHLDKFYLPLGLKKARRFQCRNKLVSV